MSLSTATRITLACVVGCILRPPTEDSDDMLIIEYCPVYGVLYQKNQNYINNFKYNFIKLSVCFVWSSKYLRPNVIPFDINKFILRSGQWISSDKFAFCPWQ